MPSFEYIDTALGNVNKRNNVMTIDELAKWLTTHPDSTDCYATYFRYPPKFIEYVKQYGSVKQYAGEVNTPYFPLDIDSDDPAQSLEIVRNLLGELEYSFEFPGQYCRIYFSGRKGFHILIPAQAFGGWGPSGHLPAVFKQIAKRIGGDRIDLSIYDRMRLFRLPNTRHGKSGLFKIPLTFTEILNNDIEQIKQLAKQPRQLDLVSFDESPESPTLRQMFRTVWQEVTSKKNRTQPTAQKTDIHCPKDEKPCIYRILAGVSENRNNAGLRLAVHFRKKGFPADMTMGIMAAWNRRNKEPLPSDELESIVKSAYSGNYDFGCNDPELQKYCQPTCRFRDKTGIDQTKIYDAQRAIEAYRLYIEKLKQITFVTGIEEIDDTIRGVAPGEVLVIIARPGNYKTAWLQNMLLGFSGKSGRYALFFSLEMPIPALVERYIAIATDQPPREIEWSFRHAGDNRAFNDADIRPDEYTNEYLTKTARIIHVRDGAVSLEKAEAYFRAINQMEKINGNLGLVAIDYLQLMKAGGHREYENVTEVARNAKELAGRLNVPVIILSQTSRKGGDGSTEITLDMGRGSGAIEEAADFQFGLYRPEPDQLIVKITKNRKGPAHRYFRIIYDPQTFKFGKHAEPYVPPTKTALDKAW